MAGLSSPIVIVDNAHPFTLVYIQIVAVITMTASKLAVISFVQKLIQSFGNKQEL